MGDRVTVQLVDNNENFSPILYGHWCGNRADDIIKKAAPIMRKGDISYAFARLVGVFHNETGPDQGLSLGVFNASEIQEEDTQGDNGHFKVNINTGEVVHYGGYTGKMEPVELGKF